MSNLAGSAAETLPYYHVDVFCDRRFAGNGLIVVPESQRLSKGEMQTITTEMRQFESIFLRHREGEVFDANVFTMQEELDFAGHPSLGAAATLHDLLKPGVDEANWVLAFPRKNIPIRTMRTAYGFEAVMNQGPASFGRALTAGESDYFLGALGISKEDLMPGFSPQVVSTGLPYLLMPMERNGLRARIGVTDLGERLSRIGAKFIGVLEVPSRSIRTWDVLGLVEDSATGSLAGPAAAWLVRNGFCGVEEPMTIRQGENLGRNSRLFGRVEAGGDVYISGGVVNVAAGQLFL
jgi:trans-2,3-dihydro-3-hydroxyanthranilate isomerase